ncbi:reverse transcriptase domain-containing protein, partial [Tanacetum coccineum]
ILPNSNPIAPEDQEKTTFTCPYGTFAYKRMPFGLCKAPATFQRCMTAIFYDMVEDFMEVFMDDFSVFGQRIDGKFKPIYYASKTLNNAQEHYTTTEKELIAVVFSFDKFRPYLILSETVVYTDHSALKLKNPDLGTFTEEEIADEFPNKHLMILKAKPNDNETWYADYVNYIVGKIVPPKWTPKKRRRVFFQVKNYLWDEPYAFRLCPNNVMRRCVAGNEILEILAYCHSRPTGVIIVRRLLEGKFMNQDSFGRVLDFIGPFHNSRGNRYILVAVDYVSKWVEAQALPTNDARVVIKILRKSFSRFGVPKALITAAKNYFMELNELMELRDGAYKNTRIYKERTKKWHDFRLRGDKDFKVRDKILLSNSRFKMHPGKLKSKWYNQNVVKTIYPYGTMEITDKTELVLRSMDKY